MTSSGDDFCDSNRITSATSAAVTVSKYERDDELVRVTGGCNKEDVDASQSRTTGTPLHAFAGYNPCPRKRPPFIFGITLLTINRLKLLHSFCTTFGTTVIYLKWVKLSSSNLVRRLIFTITGVYVSNRISPNPTTYVIVKLLQIKCTVPTQPKSSRCW